MRQIKLCLEANFILMFRKNKPFKIFKTSKNLDELFIIGN